MRRTNSLLGLVGLVLLLFAGIAAVLTRGATSVDALFILVNGVFGLVGVVAYLSAGLEQLRNVVSERSTKYGANVIVSSLVFIAILVLFNYISAQHSKRFDLTEAGVFSLSPQTVSVLNNLKDDLKAEAFVEGGLNPELRELLQTYKYHAAKMTFELIDPERQPQLAEKYHITAYNTVRLEYGKESTMVTQPSEETITNAIIKVTRSTKKTVCAVEGHGEPDIDDIENPKGLASLKQALSNENYEVKKVLLASMEKLPDDCSVVIDVGPARPLVDSEAKAIGAYLDNGGHAMLLLGARDATAELTPVLDKWGVKLGNDIVVDQVVRLFQGPALGLTPLINTYGTHEITKDFHQRTIFPMTRSVKADAGGKPGLQATDLAKSSPSSWGETDLDGLFQRSEAALDPSDTKGPVAIAVAITGDLKKMGGGKDGTTRLVVFGSSEFASNREVDGTYYNRDLLMNSVGWLVGEADLVSVRPRNVRASRVQLTQEQGTTIFYLSVLVIPELLLIAGIAVWWRRE